LGRTRGGSGFIESISKNGDAKKEKGAIENALRDGKAIDYLKSEEFEDLHVMIHYSMTE